MENAGENQEERIAKQTEVVKKLSDEYQKNPSDELKLKLDRATDVLRQISNTAKGNPLERAKKSAQFAEKSALNRAVEFSE